MNKRLGTGLPFKPGHRKDVEIFLDDEMLQAPLRWKKPRMIFVCSMTDLFADFVKDEWIDKMLAIAALCPQHTFQILTKRAERMCRYMSDTTVSSIGGGDVCSRVAAQCATHRNVAFAETVTPAKIRYCWPLENCWLGVSCERQQEADERIPLLLQTPAAVRFISAEPLLAPIDLTRIHEEFDGGLGHSWESCLNGKRFSPWGGDGNGGDTSGHAALDWVIVGGESGPNARPMQIEWADSIVAQCEAAGVACFVKQLGAAPLSDGYPLHLRSAKGGDQAEWPERLRVREMPA
jgi:protein gp37